MLQYLIDIFGFTVNDTYYNLITSTWVNIIAFLTNDPYNGDGIISLTVFSLGVGIFTLFVLCLGCFLFYKIASSFVGWFRFR